jgi:Fe-S-cluster containining protein
MVSGTNQSNGRGAGMTTLAELGPLVCAGCTACCRTGARLSLDAGDDIGSYDHVLVPPHPGLKSGDGLIAELRQVDGRCVYLGDDGCTIYERRPKVCRSFDCRAAYLFQTGDPAAASKFGALPTEVCDAARKRLGVLPSARTNAPFRRSVGHDGGTGSTDRRGNFLKDHEVLENA